MPIVRSNRTLSGQLICIIKSQLKVKLPKEESWFNMHQVNRQPSQIGEPHKNNRKDKSLIYKWPTEVISLKNPQITNLNEFTIIQEGRFLCPFHKVKTTMRAISFIYLFIPILGAL